MKKQGFGDNWYKLDEKIIRSYTDKKSCFNIHEWVDVEQILLDKAMRVQIVDIDTALRLAAPRKPMDGVVAEIRLNEKYILGFEDSYKDIKKYFPENEFLTILEKPLDKDDYLLLTTNFGYISNYRESKNKAYLETIAIKGSVRDKGLATHVLEFLINNAVERVSSFIIENILYEDKFKGNLEKFKRIAEKLEQGNVIKKFEFKHQGKIIDLELFI